MAIERQIFIAGEWRDTGRFSTVLNPYDGTEVARVALGGPAEMEAAIVAATAAFEATRALSRGERAAILSRVAQGVAGRKDAIAATMTAEMGKPLQMARAEVDRCVTTFVTAVAFVATLGGCRGIAAAITSVTATADGQYGQAQHNKQKSKFFHG